MYIVATEVVIRVSPRVHTQSVATKGGAELLEARVNSCWKQQGVSFSAHVNQ